MTIRALATASLALAMAALVLPGTARAAPEPKSIPWDDTGGFDHVDGSGMQREGHSLLLHQRNAANIAASAGAESQDIGDIAVIVDNGSILTQPAGPNLFDLASGTAIHLSPGTDEFSLAIAATALDLTFGADLLLGDDDTTEVTFPAGFPFLGTVYTDIWVNSDGNITLGEGDDASTARDAARLISGPPRISPLLVDLDPTAGGASVHADVRSDRLVVTWDNVPQFGVGDSNTFQAVLHSDGSIDLVFDAVESPIGVVGVAEGHNELPFNEVDFSADLPATHGAGAIFEEFTTGHGVLIDVLAVGEEFYKTHSDDFDFLVIFTDFVVDLQGAFAFHLGVQNQTFGLGLRDVFDSSSVAGSAGELESILNMNRIGLYWPDAKKMVNPPIKKFRFSRGAASNGPPGPGQLTRRARWMGTLNRDFGAGGSYTLGLNSAMSIMAQEAGHRWLAFPVFVHPTKGFNFVDNFDLLGRANAHWSFFFNVTVPDDQFGGDPRASGAEGNAIASFGPHPACDPDQTLFQTQPDELIDGFTELDQYFMGLRTPEDTAGFWYIDEPTFPSGPSLEFARSFAAQDDVFLCGKQVDLTVDDITAVNDVFGGGVPENGVRFFLDRDNGFAPVFDTPGDEIDQDADSNDVFDVKTMAFILVVQTNPGKKSSAVSQVDTFRSTWEEYGNGPATGGLGRFDTSLNPAVH